MQALRQELLKWDGTVEGAKKAFDFITEYKEPKADGLKEPTRTEPTHEANDKKMPDGVFIALEKDGKHYEILYEDTNIAGLPQNMEVTGVGVKWGSHHVVVALHDMANGEEITLTSNEDKTNGSSYYRKTYEDAASDMNGEKNTNHLKEIGLNENIKLKDGWYIPSMGEMLFIHLNKKKINAALKYVGGTPIADDWYWTSTEYSQTGAWYFATQRRQHVRHH